MGGLVGQTLGRYEIVALIGRGGMGEVFRARDTELGREVAVKVLPADTAKNEGRIRRFTREARAVAQLSHPNILDIYDFGSEDGVTYSVTELLEGEDLQQRLEGRPLPLSKVLKVGRSAAEGLAAAHSKGIVHRDIKPANIFISRNGHVKILDFGIASLKDHFTTGAFSPDAPTKTLTQAGQVVGTAAYMSPEQVAGTPVDPRSDIFSLGCVLYEMVAGRRAFEGATAQETMVAIVSHDPPPLAELRPDVPYALDLLIRRCLEKEPDERFESARDVAFALQALSDDRASSRPIPAMRRIWTRRNVVAAAVGAAVVALVFFGWHLASRWLLLNPELPQQKHLAILEFKSSGNVAGLESSAVGLGRLVSRGLSVVEREYRAGFWVVAEADATRHRASTAEDFRRVFGANLALIGRLTRIGTRLQLDLEVTALDSETVLRRITVEDEVSNLSTFQEGLILSVADILGLAVGQQTREYLTDTATTMPEGFAAYVEGLGELTREADPEILDRVITLMETATTVDPLFAAGKVGLGRAFLAKYVTTGERAWVERAFSEAKEAINLDPATEDAYLFLSEVHRSREEPEAMVRALESAVRVAPTSAQARLALAEGYRSRGRVEESRKEAEYAVFLRPGYWPAHDFLAKIHIANGDYVAAAFHFGQVVDCAPELTNGYNNLGGVLVLLERNDEAKVLFERSMAISPSRTALSNLGVIYFDEKRFADAATMFERAIDIDDSRYRIWGNLGYAYKFGPSPEKAPGCFHMAVELATVLLDADPGNLWAKTELAGYYAMLDQPEKGLPLLKSVAQGHTVEPQLIAKIAETYEDLGERDLALKWVGRAFLSGVSPRRFEVRPTLRELVADERFRELVDELNTDASLDGLA